MVSLVLISIAAMCNALMDVTSHHFYESIFSMFKDRDVLAWFRSPDSWKLKYNWKDGKIIGRKRWRGIKIPVQFTDAWHFFKMLMITIICLSVAFYNPIVSPYVDWIFFGVAWNLSFSFHYNYSFRL